MIKVQWVSIGMKPDLCSENGELIEHFTTVIEGEKEFDINKPYELISEIDFFGDYGFTEKDEARAIELMYERSYHWSNPLE